jgi:hypothetical protein
MITITDSDGGTWRIPPGQITCIYRDETQGVATIHLVSRLSIAVDLPTADLCCDHLTQQHPPPPG